MNPFEDPQVWRRIPRSVYIRAGFWFSWGVFIFTLDVAIVVLVVGLLAVGFFGIDPKILQRLPR